MIVTNPTNSKFHTSRQPGMYEPSFEHDGCGVGFIADIQGRQSREIIDQGLNIMCNLEHRGAIGADPLTGDGAGMTIQLPDDFFRKAAEKIKINLPIKGRYGVGMHFFPQEMSKRRAIENIVEKIVTDEEQIFLGWREVPVNPDAIGEGAREMMPYIGQSFIQANDSIKNIQEFERKLFMIRRIIDHRIRLELHEGRSTYYVSSFSAKTIVYKGMLLGEQFTKFYSDMKSKDMKSALAMIHTRFSTNTFPSWDLAHPFRLVAHNGEINTLRGNTNWMAAREKVMSSPYFNKDLKRMFPILMEGQSDSAAFDSVLELLVMAGRSLPHAIMMMIPEAWSKNELMDQNKRGFYEYHATMMEPWDGPAGVTFTDGDIIGGTLDRNGLRPARYVVTKDDLVVLSSEAGVLPFDSENIKFHGRLQPGKMFLVNLLEQRIVPDEEIKEKISTRKPYLSWVKEKMIHIDELPTPKKVKEVNHTNVRQRQRAFLYTREDIDIVLAPMLTMAKEGTGSMGTDASLAVLSEKPQLLFRYFKQLFAQVTNPPIDAIREELVMELTTYLGPEQNLLNESAEHAHRIELSHPIISDEQLEKVREVAQGHFKAASIPMLFNIHKKHNMRERMDEICEEAERLVKDGVSLLILSDRYPDKDHAPISSLLVVSGVHHHLIRNGLRTKTSILLESGEPREVSHFALLLGYGANAINPYLAFETIADLFKTDFLPKIKSIELAYKNYFKAIEIGLFKVFSKMGISTLQSYLGAQIFEAVGIDSEVVDTYFTGTTTKIEGMSLEMLEKEMVKRHKEAYKNRYAPEVLPSGGLYYYRYDGEHHLWNPFSIAKLQISTRNNDYQIYKEYAKLVNEQENKRVTLRSLLELIYAKNPIPIDEVEPVSEIVKRFATGAMSFGSISWEAHTSLAIAMNQLGGKSNTGEGGEDPIRFKKSSKNKNMRSAIKQVASGRFGVTAEYLVNADELQIKMAQGAKPGEGGQLPGFKVDKIIAKIRHSTPGVTLISPPPHHDIYSIEDLKQLIFDLKNINPQARISVKLVSEVGVGTIAAGVAKAHADHILISGHDGGTGASPLSSIQYAGTPLELGLSETQQTLVLNGLRDRVCVQVDGQIKTGRDVIIGALMGADEFGFATTALVTQGCIMMRKCHLNTCPVGVATQDKELRKKFNGSPQYLVNYMLFVAEEVREYMSRLGFKTFNEMIGQVDRLTYAKPKNHWKTRGIDLGHVLVKAKPKFATGIYHQKSQNHGLDKQIDIMFIKQSKRALEKKEPVQIETNIRNINRSVGTMLSHEIAKRYGHTGLPDKTIDITLHGFAGQSLGAFLSRGVQIKIYGAANDYVGKGISGGRLIIQTPENVSFDPSKNIIVGNTSFYGAIEGEAFINGMAGERFCVRNSGVHAVVEGVGDHGCEYMTGGQVVILGEVGRNFGAGMSGGIAYIWDTKGNFQQYANHEMIEIESLQNEASISEVLSLIKRHCSYTNSHRAKYILNDWDEQKKYFHKVIPEEYRLAMRRLTEENKSEIKQEEHLLTNH